MPPRVPDSPQHDSMATRHEHESSRLADASLSDVDRLQIELAAIKGQLARADRLATLGTLAAMVAHEFNNILTPLMSYAEMALARPEDQDLLRKAAQKSLQSGQRASALARSVLGFAHGHDEDGADHADVRQSIEDAERCMAREHEKEGVAFHVELDDSESPLIAAIPAVHLQHVVLNLLLNATRAMREKGGKVDITAQRIGNNIEITVADNGPGIPADIADRVFEPFVQGQTPTAGTSVADANRGEPGLCVAASAAGSGLGLAVCRDLVRRAHGDIRLKTNSDQGAAFEVLLPVYNS